MNNFITILLGILAGGCAGTGIAVLLDRVLIRSRRPK
jgi:hypothetical protein